MSTTLGTILVAVDFGEASARALSLASVLAGNCGARLRVMHAEAIEAPPYFTAAQLDVIQGEDRANLARATQFLQTFAAARTSQPFDVVVENRSATDAILHASRAVDLLVMGTHGRRGPSRWWLGSVAERVLRDTRVPLLVAHAGSALSPDRAFATAMLVADEGRPGPRACALARQIASCVSGTVVEAEADEVRQPRTGLDATWVVVSAPTPRTGSWLSQVGEPLVTSCTMPVLFVPDAEGVLVP